MNNDTKPQVKKLTEGLYYVTEEPGDATHYSFVIAVLPQGQTFPDSIYEVAVFPTKDDGATVSKPLYAERRFLSRLGNSSRGKDVREQASEAVSYTRPGEEACTIASAIRCAMAAVEAVAAIEEHL